MEERRRLNNERAQLPGDAGSLLQFLRSWGPQRADPPSGAAKDLTRSLTWGPADGTAPAEEEPPPGAGLLLFSVGSDLDLGPEAATPEPTEGAAEEEPPDVAAARAKAEKAKHLTGFSLQLAKADGPFKALADSLWIPDPSLPPLTPRGTHHLVHLRDGVEQRGERGGERDERRRAARRDA